MIIIETCPKCGGDLRDEVICTYPPIPRKVCSNCGWSWEGEQEKIVRVPFSSSFPDKRCNKKAPERGKRIKCHPIDDAAYIPNENEVKRNCHKCVYEVGCHGNPVGCKSYKRDAPDGGYYG